jgi:sigma-B regulation protein RsbU (phosphoserine phosphatase)
MIDNILTWDSGLPISTDFTGKQHAHNRLDVLHFLSPHGSAHETENDFEPSVKIQRSLLPQPLPRINGFDIAGRCQPAQRFSGDLFDCFKFGDNSFDVCIGDACGHGLPAALLIRDVMKNLRMFAAQSKEVLSTIEMLNQVLYHRVSANRLVSLFYCEIEQNGYVTFANAGHPAPLVVSGNHVEELNATGTLLGALARIDWHAGHTKLAPNTILVLYSDGIIERKNALGQNYGLSRLRKLTKDNSQQTAKEILDLIFAAVFEFGNAADWRDDATAVVIKKLAGSNP